MGISNCTILTNIPVGLFNTTNITNFSNCFDKCTSLKRLPNGIFYYNILVDRINKIENIKKKNEKQ